ncbi:Uncharacterised protein [Mycobacterium tuberculosis]|nr:Uncharacterised protein [Mycobacterium tuberculosis]
MNQPIDDLVRRQFGELSTYQRSHPGHDRGGKTGASRNQQRIIRAVNRIDQAVVTGRESDDVGSRRRNGDPGSRDTHFAERLTVGVNRSDRQDVVVEPRGCHHRGDRVPSAWIVGLQGIKNRVLLTVLLAAVARCSHDDRVLVDRGVVHRGTQCTLVDDITSTHAHHIGDIDHRSTHVGSMHNRARHCLDVVDLLRRLRVFVPSVRVLKAEGLA